MTIVNALASLAVRDLDAARRWYEPLFSEPSQPMPEVLEWHFDNGGGLQVYAGPERAGNGSCTVIVDDIDAMAKELREAGVADIEPNRDDRVDTIMIKDPDGNSIAFSKPKDDTLVR